MSQGVYVLGGKCPGGMCPGGKCPGGMCPWGKCPGGTCPGGLCPRTMPNIHKMLSTLEKRKVFTTIELSLANSFDGRVKRYYIIHNYRMTFSLYANTL